ncbi:PAS domain-containing hybrid sensor histidine kinase/response regulator [Desulfatirhabdium butyrativorans]|uniref:PAS domain-containing hybrid sensor histidine kinase/response regulator n=1 Tax=Desulfatirhabdium butyrativorans TaxID=340467 RepID=UPI000425510E|nr:PAS domain-containing sensor histidine kinase [Desulfatirhabdium butyrativorans]
MKNASENEPKWDVLREQIIGLGERSIRKSYYPELRHRLEELEHFRQLLDLANDIILSFELPSTRIIHFNRSVSAVLGYSPEQVASLTLKDLCPDLAMRIIAQWAGDTNPGAAVAADAMASDLFTQSGTAVPIEATFGMRSMHGRMLGIVVARQIGERLQAERQLKESEARYRRVIENADEAIFVLQRDMIRFANRQTASILPVSEQELYATPFWQMLHPSDQAYARHLSNPDQIPVERATPKTLRWLGPNGDIHWIELHQVAVTWEGKPATLNFARDITQSKQLEEQLRQSRKMEAIGTLAGGIAHDFNNILSIIIGNLELALDSAQTPDAIRKQLLEMHRAGLKARDVLRQLLSFSRKSEITHQPIEPAATAAEAIRLLRSSIPSSIDIQFQKEGTIGAISADPTQFQQIILNLGTNAFHAMENESSGRISLTLRNAELKDGLRSPFANLPPGHYLQMVFSDTGRGIEAGNLHRIFDPYFTTKAPGRGTGMGLAVVHGIVQNHGGAITVASEPGQGTTFYLYFPTTTQTATSHKEKDIKPVQGSGCILFVDDEPSLAELGQAMLTTLGYQVVATTQPREALALFAQDPTKFDLVITDLTMPQISGDRLAKELCALRPDIPVILCTGYSDWMPSNADGSAGIRICLQKPVRMAELAKAVSATIGSRQAVGSGQSAVGSTSLPW